MDSYDLDVHGLTYVAAMEARATSQKIKRNNDPCVAQPNQTQSTTGFETIEAKDHIGLIQRDQTNTCTNSEIPHSTISAITALMNDLSLDSQDEFPSMPMMFTDNESDDGWSVVSDGNDFVVVDTAETVQHSSNDASKEGLEGRLFKPKAESSTTTIRGQSVVVCHDGEKEPTMVSVVHESRSEQVKHRQHCANIKNTDNIIDELVERNAERVRAWSKALAAEVQEW
jgi:galactose-1-phosphate uridylyltransferase